MGPGHTVHIKRSSLNWAQKKFHILISHCGEHGGKLTVQKSAMVLMDWNLTPLSPAVFTNRSVMALV